MPFSFFKKSRKHPKEQTFDLTSMHVEHLSEGAYDTFHQHIEEIVEQCEGEGDRAFRFEESSIYFDWQNPHQTLHIELTKSLIHCQKSSKQGRLLESALLFFWQQRNSAVRMKFDLEKVLVAQKGWLGEDETYALRDLVFKQFFEFEKACMPDSLDELYDEEALTKYQNIGVPQLNAFVETFYSHLFTFKKVCDDTESRLSDDKLATSLNALFSAVERLEPIAVSDVAGHLAYV